MEKIDWGGWTPLEEIREPIRAKATVNMIFGYEVGQDGKTYAFRKTWDDGRITYFTGTVEHIDGETVLQNLKEPL